MRLSAGHDDVGDDNPFCTAFNGDNRAFRIHKATHNYYNQLNGCGQLFMWASHAPVGCLHEVKWLITAGVIDELSVCDSIERKHDNQIADGMRFDISIFIATKIEILYPISETRWTCTIGISTKYLLVTIDAIK